MPLRPLVGAVFLAIFSTFAFAEDDRTNKSTDAPRTAQLEMENRALRAQVDSLTRELAVLRAPAATQSSPVMAAPLVAFPATQPVQAPSTTQPHTTTYTSLLDMLRELPPDARPHSETGWNRGDKFGPSVFEAAESFLKRAIPGNTFDARLQIVKVSINRTPHTNNHNSEGKPDWYVSIEFASVQHKYQAVVFTQHVIASSYMNRFTLYGDADFAHRAEKIKAGQWFRVTGKVADVDLYRESNTRTRASIMLREYAIPALVP